jgi:hypothetical protein
LSGIDPEQCRRIKSYVKKAFLYDNRITDSGCGVFSHDSGAYAIRQNGEGALSQDVLR